MTDDDPFHATKTQPQSRSQTSQDHSCPPMLHDGIEVEVVSSDDDCHNSGSHDEQNCDSSYSESDSGDKTFHIQMMTSQTRSLPMWTKSQSNSNGQA